MTYTIHPLGIARPGARIRPAAMLIELTARLSPDTRVDTARAAAEAGLRRCAVGTCRTSARVEVAHRDGALLLVAQVRARPRWWAVAAMLPLLVYPADRGRALRRARAVVQSYGTSAPWRRWGSPSAKPAPVTVSRVGLPLSNRSRPNPRSPILNSRTDR